MTGEATRTEDLLRVEGVSLSFGSKLVLRDVHAEIKNLHRDTKFDIGQVVAFLGPSGIGKTQLLRILAGLQKPTAGQVLVGPEQKTVKAGMVGMVSQKYQLYRNRTVWGNLMVAARQQYDWRLWYSAETRGKLIADCAKMLDTFGLADKRDRYPAELSGGQQQRVAIAQQLLCSDHFILMDEPTTGLDPVSKQKVCQLMTNVAEQHDLNTIIMVTHDIPSALAVADTVWLMGRDRTPEGALVPGARIVDTYDLIERGLCWHPEVHRTEVFSDLVQEIQERFETL